MDSKKIVLIGGAPTIGKSYLARRLAEELRLPWISTDSIREAMRQIVRREDYPDLFLFHDSTLVKNPEEYLTGHTPQEIVTDQNAESVEVWKGVKAFIDTDYVWGSFIVEGVAILPDLVSLLTKENKSVRPVFLVDNNWDRVREVVFARGLWDDAEKYSDSVKEIEVEWVMSFNEWIIREAKKYQFPIVEITDRNNYVEKAIFLVNS